MSFFDEVDEPPRTEPRTTPRTTSRGGPRGRRPSGPGGRVAARPAISRRSRPGARSRSSSSSSSSSSSRCSSTAARSAPPTRALQDYTNNVSSLNQQSAANGQQLFTQLSQAAESRHRHQRPERDQPGPHRASKNVYKKATDTSVPDQVKTGNADFLKALKMRVDGISDIAKEIQPALSSTATQAPSTRSPPRWRRFYASDVALQGLHAAADLQRAARRRHPLQPHQRRPVPAQRRVGAAQLHRLRAARERPGRPADQGRAGPARPLADVGQRRRHARCRPGATNTIPASPPPPSRSTSPTAAPTTSTTSSARSPSTGRA